VDGPRLATHLGGGPPRHHSYEAERSNDLACSEEPERFEETPPIPQPPACHDEAKHDDPNPHHDAEGEERDRDWRAIPGGPILQAFDNRVRIVSQDEASEDWNFDGIAVRLIGLVRNGEKYERSAARSCPMRFDRS